MPQGRIPIPSPTDVGDEFDAALLRRLIDFLRERDHVTYNSLQDVLITGAPDDVGRKPRLILRADDDTYWSVVVDGAGALSTEQVDPLTFPRGPEGFL